MIVVLVVVMASFAFLCMYVVIEMVTKDMSEKEKEEVWENFYKQLNDTNLYK